MPQMFGTITVSDGISMGTEGMKYSLVSREVIADSIETVCGAARVDGLLAIGGCDKNMPGAMIAIARLNIPSIFVYGGTIKPGHLDGQRSHHPQRVRGRRRIQRGTHQQGRAARSRAALLPRRRLLRRNVHREHHVLRHRGHGHEPAVLLDHGRRRRGESRKRRRIRARAGSPPSRTQLLPRQIMTRKAFENAIAVVMAIGGSTNAVLHLLAIAHAANVPLSLDDFETIRQRVPVLCDLKPSGKYVATESASPPAAFRKS